MPTLARPTQKACKAGRGPAGRAPPACGGRGLLGTIRWYRIKTANGRGKGAGMVRKFGEGFASLSVALVI
ncbi:hypothetical protein AVEN_118319-1 [Araneus ventricosus]|uniref:Uncharacterized protein n=1 Tax=Araneus ventricosus TaxID=182803 RepID=A0A4Y2B8J8_ARAVE|nr:hypothetical protein AVEN_118319-1 [Araneus ventricosus]